MFKHERFPTLFFKYLTSYIAVLCIPLVIIFVLVYAQFMNILKDEVITNNLNTLNKLKNVVDSQINQLKNTSFQISLNTRLRPFYFYDDPYNAVTSKAELLNYKSTNNFVSEILIYFRGDNYLYSSSSSYTIDMFISKIYNYEKWDFKDFYNELNTVKNYVIRPNERVLVNYNTWEQYITFLFPLINKSTPYGTVIFMVPQSSLKSLIKDYYNENNSNTVILDNNNNIIYSSRDVNSSSSEEIKHLLELHSEAYSGSYEINSSSYLFNLIQSKDTGWKYVSTVPAKEVMEKVNTVRNSMLLGIIIIVLVGSITIYYLMHINYTPLNRLKAYSDTILNSTRSKNEIESVKRTIEYLSTNNVELSAKVKDSVLATKEHLLLGILKGKIKSAEEFNSKSKSYGIVLSKQYFSVAIFYINGLKAIDEKMEKQSLIREIELNLSNDIEGYGVDHIEPDKVMLIFAADRPDISTIEKDLLNIQAYFKATWGLLFTIGIGNIYNDFLSLPKAYMEASTSINYRLIKGSDKVIFFQEIMTEQYIADSYPQKDLEMLKLSIKQSDISKIESIINRIIKFIKEYNTPLFIARCLCFDIINTVIKSTNDINKELSIENKNYPDVFSLAEFETVEELSEIIMRMCSDACTFVNEVNKNHNINFTEQLIGYIKERYLSCDFTIDEVAAHFNMSPPNLSLFFKEHTGQTFIDYVTYLKLEKAKQLLIYSNLPLKDVSVSVGYYNVSSFIRRFKQVIGTTPGEYRSDNRMD